MRVKLFPIFITFLGLIAVFAFYTVWNTEELNPKKFTKVLEDEVLEDLTSLENIPKLNPIFPSQKHIKTTPINNNHLADKNILDNKDLIPNLTQEEMDIQTQEVYANLKPDNYEEIMENAKVAFEAIDDTSSELSIGYEQEEEQSKYDEMDG